MAFLGLLAGRVVHFAIETLVLQRPWLEHHRVGGKSPQHRVGVPHRTHPWSGSQIGEDLQLLEGNTYFQACQRCSRTLMGARTKGQVFVRGRCG